MRSATGHFAQAIKQLSNNDDVLRKKVRDMLKEYENKITAGTVAEASRNELNRVISDKKKTLETAITDALQKLTTGEETEMRTPTEAAANPSPLQKFNQLTRHNLIEEVSEASGSLKAFLKSHGNNPSIRKNVAAFLRAKLWEETRAQLGSPDQNNPAIVAAAFKKNLEALTNAAKDSTIKSELLSTKDDPIRNASALITLQAVAEKIDAENVAQKAADKQLSDDYQSAIKTLKETINAIEQDKNALSEKLKTANPTEAQKITERVTLLEAAINEMQKSSSLLADQQKKLSEDPEKNRQQAQRALKTHLQVTPEPHQTIKQLFDPEKINTYKTALNTLKELAEQYKDSSPYGSALTLLQKNISEFNQAVSTLQEISQKMISPAAAKAYQAEYDEALASAVKSTQTLDKQFSDPAAQALLKKAYKDSENSDQLANLTKQIADIRAALLDQLSWQDAFRQKLGNKINPTPTLGQSENCLTVAFNRTEKAIEKNMEATFGLTYKEKNPRTGKFENKMPTDKNGNRLPDFTLAQLTAFIDKKNQEGRAKDPFYKDITLTKNRFSKGYTIDNHTPERRTAFHHEFADYIRSQTPKPTSTAVTYEGAPKERAPIVPTSATGDIAPPPTKTRTKETVMQELKTALEENKPDEVKKIINIHASMLSEKECNDLYNTMTSGTACKDETLNAFASSIESDLKTKEAAAPTNEETTPTPGTPAAS